MDRLLSRYLMRAPDGGGGGGGDPAAAPGAAPAAPPSAAPDGGAAPPAAPGAGDGGAPVAGQQPAAPADPNAGAADPYFPAGLPDTMKGKTERETMDNLAKALNGYRERDAKADVPKEPAGYLNLEGLEGFTVPDEMKSHFDALKDDGVFQAAAETAAAEKIGRGAFNKIMLSAFTAAQKGGLLEPPVDAEAERAALLPEAAKSLPKADQDKAIDQRMEDNFAFVSLLSERGLDKEAADHAQMMLGDSAKGHAFLEFVRDQMVNGTQQPLDLGRHKMTDTQKQLAAELEKPEMQSNHPKFDKAAYENLMQRYREAFPG